MINFLHLSDLHYTGEETGLRRDYSKAAAGAILTLVRDLKAAGSLSESLRVAITGDLVQAGGYLPADRPSDFDAVQKEFLEPLLDTLDIDQSRVFLVPGNHEMDRGAVDEGSRLLAYKDCSEHQVHEDLRSKLSNYFDFIEKYGYNSVTRENPRIAKFDVDGQQVVCLNGLVGSYSRPGLEDKGHLFHLPTEMAGSFSDIQEFSIVLMHHPMSWFYDESELTLREFLANKRSRLLTGHIHRQCVGETKTQKGQYVTIQAGASSETKSTSFSVGVAWLPPSNGAAVRHFQFDELSASFPEVPIDQTQVSPEGAKGFFERSEAFFNPNEVPRIAREAKKENETDLEAFSGQALSCYIPPDMMKFTEDQFSGRRASIDEIASERGNLCISGYDLSGKSSLLNYLCYLNNQACSDASGCIGIMMDFREFSDVSDGKDFLFKRMSQFGGGNRQSEYLLRIGKIRLFIDNIDPTDIKASEVLFGLTRKFPKLKWTVATRGSERFMPSRAPVEFEAHRPKYFQTSETTLPTVLKMIENHKDCNNTDQPRSVVQQVFRSIQNLNAPRSMFYVGSMLDIFLTDASVEPLNRYLLIENLISERIREAHRIVFPGQPVDTQMLDALIGQFAYDLLQRQAQISSKAQFLTLVEDFIEKKGIQRKRFEPEKVLDTLLKANVLRSYSNGYGFIILSVEDYFLAKHMNQDEPFREKVLTEQGLLTLPGVAEYYVAQNPNDRPRIEKIFEIIANFEKEVAPLIEEISESAVRAIQSASPGHDLNLQQELIDDLALVDDAEEASMLQFAEPIPIGQTNRVKRTVEERGAVLLQLGASVLGVTRTLDQNERIEIFGRLRNLLLTCIKGVPMLAHHLADGHVVKFRGVNVKAEYTGQLKVQEDRFYIILRGILHNMFKNFSTWSGSPSFFKSAVELRKGEDDEFVATALYAQNIEADLSEALDFVPEVTTTVESLVLREIVARLYIDAMTLVPLERDVEARGVDKLVDLTAEIDPPKGSAKPDQMRQYKDRLRRHYSEEIGLNTYIGRRLVKK